VTNPADNPNADNPNPVPPAEGPQPDSPTTPAAGTRQAAWYRRLPGRLGVWVAALALVAACVIGGCGFIAGAVVSHGFGERGVSRDDHWGPQRQRGDNGEYGPGDGRGPNHRRGRLTPTPVPSGTVTPTPTRPSTPSPAPSPTA
jgi:hypothetical protein